MTESYIKRREAILSLSGAIKKNERHNYSIKDLIVDSFLMINHELFKVVEVSTYLETKWNFEKKINKFLITELKLFSTKTGKFTFIEWEDDDELIVSITTEELKLKDLFNVGNSKSITTQDIENIAEDENGSLFCKNLTFDYVEDETWAALYNSVKYKDVRVKMFEFESDNGDYLTVEVWHDDNKPAKEAFLSKPLSISNIVIIKI